MGIARKSLEDWRNTTIMSADKVRIIYVSKWLTSGNAEAFARSQENPLVIDKIYCNGVGRKTNYYRFVKIVPDGKVAFGNTLVVEKDTIKEVML